MILETRAVGVFMKNGYVLGCERTGEGVVIDPGDEVDQLLEIVAARQLAIRYILLTHAHMDHITGVGQAKQALNVPVGLHRDDLFLYRGIVQQGLAFGFHVDPQPAVDFFYDGPGPWRFGDYGASVYHTPGHSPGGVCLAIKKHRADGEPDETEPPVLIVGDTLFAGSVGRPDLPGGDMPTLLRSIRDVLFAFPDDCVVHSGHGPVTTIGREKRTNPYLLDR